jgi:molybdate transport system substrate-binding protein
MRLPQASICGLFAAFSLCAGPLAWADVVQVAVASNFAAPLKVIVTEFERSSGHTVSTSSASTGKLYSQIKNAAPFDVFLSGDEATPLRLQTEGLAVANTRFTYAVGGLALWSADAALVDARGDVLKTAQFTRLALASPKAAPYGVAAVETLRSLNVLDALQPKFVTGESIAQAYSFVATGNVPLGFVALSQVTENGKLKSGSMWKVPAGLHAPLKQDAVLLTRARTHAAAIAFMAFLKADSSRATIRAFGYDI